MSRLRVTLGHLAARARRSAKLAAAIALSSTAVAALTARLDPLDVLGLRSADQSMYDRGLTRFTLHPQTSEDVVIVAVDDRTLQMVAASPGLRQTYGSWPYFRTAWLHLAEHLTAEGARAVVLDFTFDEPASDPSGDTLLGEGLARGRLPVYVGVAASPAGAPLPRVQPRNLFPQEIAPPPSAPTASSDEFVEVSGPPPLTR